VGWAKGPKNVVFSEQSNTRKQLVAVTVLSEPKLILAVPNAMDTISSDIFLLSVYGRGT
jgi:hypothetical protein